MLYLEGLWAKIKICYSRSVARHKHPSLNPLLASSLLALISVAA